MYPCFLVPRKRTRRPSWVAKINVFGKGPENTNLYTILHTYGVQHFFCAVYAQPELRKTNPHSAGSFAAKAMCDSARANKDDRVQGSKENNF